jgi:hypothetical protein
MSMTFRIADRTAIRILCRFTQSTEYFYQSSVKCRDLAAMGAAMGAASIADD